MASQTTALCCSATLTLAHTVRSIPKAMLSSAVVLNPLKTIFRPAQKSPGRLQGVGATRARKQGSASQASHLLFTTHTPQVGSLLASPYELTILLWLGSLPGSPLA